MRARVDDLSASGNTVKTIKHTTADIKFIAWNEYGGSATRLYIITVAGQSQINTVRCSYLRASFKIV